jgi:hypothetical protein
MDSEFSVDVHGNTIARRSMGGDRYAYDHEHCTPADGWRAYPTPRDAPYFGMWVHERFHRIVVFAGGDETRTLCPDADPFAPRSPASWTLRAPARAPSERDDRSVGREARGREGRARVAANEDGAPAMSWGAVLGREPEPRMGARLRAYR